MWCMLPDNLCMYVSECRQHEQCSEHSVPKQKQKVEPSLVPRWIPRLVTNQHGLNMVLTTSLSGGS